MWCVGVRIYRKVLLELESRRISITWKALDTTSIADRTLTITFSTFLATGAAGRVYKTNSAHHPIYTRVKTVRGVYLFGEL